MVLGGLNIGGLEQMGIGTIQKPSSNRPPVNTQTNKYQSVVETTPTPKTDANSSQNMSFLPQSSGVVNTLASTSTVIDRQIEDLKAKKPQVKLDLSKGFGGFEGITKPLGTTPYNQEGIGKQTQMTNWKPEEQQKVVEEAQKQQVEQPVDTKLNLIQFGDKIKSKYPEYNDIESTQLAKKMLDKYPEYNDMVKKRSFEEQGTWGKIMYTPETEEERKSMPRWWKAINLGSKNSTEELNRMGWSPKDTASSSAFISEFPKMVMNVASFVSGDEGLKTKGEEIQKEIYEAMGTQQGIGGFNEKAATFVAQLLPTLLVPEGKIADLGVGFLAKTPKLRNLLLGVNKLGVPELTTAGKALRNTIASELGMETFAIASEGRNMNLVEAGLGLIPGGLTAIAPITKKAISEGALKIAKGLETSGIINPAKFAQLQEHLLVMGDKGFEKATAEDLSQWMLDRKIGGSKNEIVEQLTNRAEKASETLDTTLSTSTKTYLKKDIPVIDRIITKLEEEYTDSMSSAYQAKLSKIQQYRQKLENGTITLKEVNELKQMVWKDLNPYTSSGKVKAAKEDLASATSELKRFIEKEAENTLEGVKANDIALLNNEISTSYGLAQGIARKEATDFRQELINFWSARAGSSIMGGIAGSQIGPFDSNTTFGKVGNILLGAFLGKMTSSTKAKTRLANKLNSTFSKSEIPTLEKYIQMFSNGEVKAIPQEMKVIETKLKSIVDDADRQLVLPYKGDIGQTPNTIIAPSQKIIGLPEGGAMKEGTIFEKSLPNNQKRNGLSNMTNVTNSTDSMIGNNGLPNNGVNGLSNLKPNNISVKKPIVMMKTTKQGLNTNITAGNSVVQIFDANGKSLGYKTIPKSLETKALEFDTNANMYSVGENKYHLTAGDTIKKQPNLGEMTEAEFNSIKKASVKKPLLAKSDNQVVRMNGDINESKLNELVAIHNLNADKLKKIVDLGGMPAPSIAITKKGIPFEDFGDITLVGNKNLIQSKGSNIYTTDVYSPRVTQPTLVPKKGKELNDLITKIAKETDQPEWRISNKIDNRSDKKYFLDDMPELKKYESKIDGMFDKKIFKGFSYTGKRQYKDYNLDNVLKDMISQGKQGSESSIFEGSLNQMTAKEANKIGLSNLKKFNFSEKDKLDDIYKATDDKRLKAIDAIAEKSDANHYDVVRNIAYEVSNKRSTESIVSELNKYGIKADYKDVDNLKSIIKEALSLPKSYVEAKIWRGVGLDEFTSVLVPEDQALAVKSILKGTDLENKIVTYAKGEPRSSKLADVSKKYGNVFFGIGGVMIPAAYLYSETE